MLDLLSFKNVTFKFDPFCPKIYTGGVNLQKLQLQEVENPMSGKLQNSSCHDAHKQNLKCAKILYKQTVLVAIDQLVLLVSCSRNTFKV